MSEQEHCSIGSTHGTPQVLCDRTTPTTNDSNPPSLSAGENSRQIPISIDSDGDHTTVSVGRKRKLTSEVWNHFMLKNVDNEIKAICTYCGAKLVGHSKNGTNHLKKHLDRCTLRKCKQTDIRQAILNPTKQAGGKVVMGTYHFDQDHARTELGKMIILHEYPLCMVEHVGFRNFVKSIQPLFKVGSSNMKSELDLYLEEPVLPRSSDFDLLNWWKANSSKYNTLLKLARDILAIPVSTVASESAFSTSGRFVSPHRSRLHPSTLEALMCAQNWLWADIHENSPPSSSYTGCCSTITHEEIEEEEPLGSDYVTTTQEEE